MSLISIFLGHTTNNYSKFMIFLIKNVQVSIIASKSKLPILFLFVCFCFVLFFVFCFFPQGVSLRFQNTQSNNTLGIEFFSKKFLEVYIYTFGFDRVKFSAFSLTFKEKKIQFLCKFIYFYFLMFSNLSCS